MDSGGGGMGGEPAATPAIKPAKKADPKEAFYRSLVKPRFTIPAEGQYIVFADFFPRGGDEVILTAPLAVGSAQTAQAVLTPDANLTRTIDDLNLTFKPEQPLKAGQYNYITFEAVDSQGQSRADEIQLLSGRLCQLDIIDASLTTFLRPDFIDRPKLQYSVYFPKPGIYKAFFTFRYANQKRQASYVFEVKPAETVEK
jgi:hypothetical protein